MQSRHTSSKTYNLWIQYEPEEKISGWYCQCKTGARTIGCCAHIAAVIWFLSFERFEEIIRQEKKRNHNQFIVTASDVISSEENSEQNYFEYKLKKT